MVLLCEGHVQPCRVVNDGRPLEDPDRSVSKLELHIGAEP
jgi:hypothetical protein